MNLNCILKVADTVQHAENSHGIMKRGHSTSKQAPVSSHSLFTRPLLWSHQVKREEKKRKPFASAGRGESGTNCP